MLMLIICCKERLLLVAVAIFGKKGLDNIKPEPLWHSKEKLPTRVSRHCRFESLTARVQGTQPTLAGLATSMSKLLMLNYT